VGVRRQGDAKERGGDLEVHEKGEERKADIQYLFVRWGNTGGK
jgi:hypothetical protein